MLVSNLHMLSRFTNFHKVSQHFEVQLKRSNVCIYTSEEAFKLQKQLSFPPYHGRSLSQSRIITPTLLYCDRPYLHILRADGVTYNYYIHYFHQTTGIIVKYLLLSYIVAKFPKLFNAKIVNLTYQFAVYNAQLNVTMDETTRS